MENKKGKQAKDDGLGWDACEICGRPVVFGVYDVCTVCRPQRERQYQKIIDYLRDHHGADVMTVSSVTGVPGSLVLKLMRRGSIKVPKAALKCANCGKAIEEGKFCADCGRKMGSKNQKGRAF